MPSNRRFPPPKSLLPFVWAMHRGEVPANRRSEIDMCEGVIDLPSERTKNGNAHFVPLSAGTYNRANYHSERKQALEKWAAHIIAPVTKPKGVVRADARMGAKPMKAIPSN